MFLHRRRLLATAGAATLLSAARLRRAKAQAPNGPIKIPVVMALSGPLALVGEQVRLGTDITAEMINKSGGILGRPLELVYRDDKGLPADSIAVVRELTSTGSNLLIAGLTSVVTNPILPVLAETKAVAVLLAAQGLPVTHELYTRYMFRCSDDEYQRARGHAKLASERTPDARKWGAIFTDAQTYRDIYANFQKFATDYYTAIGGAAPTFADPIQVKFGTTDFRTQLAQLSSLDIDALLTIVVGADSVTCWQQARAFGIASKFKIVLDQSIDLAAAKTLQSNLPPNMWTITPWYSENYPNNTISRTMAAEYVARTKNPIPSGYLGYGHLCVMAVAEGIRGAHGATDSESFISATEGLKFLSAKGDVWFRREDHQLIQDTNYINIVPLDKDPGYRIVHGLSLPGAELVEPPTPGVKFVRT